MSDEIRLCVQCRFFDSSYESPGGGCDTCGYGAGKGFTLECSKKHFHNESPYDRNDFFGVIRTAQSCEDFDALTPEEIAAL